MATREASQIGCIGHRARGAGSSHSVGGVRELFLDNARVVLTAVSDRRVADAWDDDSVLENQTVGSLSGHLARGSVWVVGDYLDADPPDRPVDFETAAEYFTALTSALTADDHAAIRQRGAAVAAEGHRPVVEELAGKLDRLGRTLVEQPSDRLVAVFAGRVMRLEDYLLTRLVEQVVHLDDLARSLRVEPWSCVPEAEALVVSCGAEIGRLRYGGTSMIRTLFRDFDVTLPVL